MSEIKINNIDNINMIDDLIIKTLNCSLNSDIKISNGAKAVNNGKKYEKDVYCVVKDTYINDKKFNIQNENELGGNSYRPDMKCIYNNLDIIKELKNDVNAEFIQVDVIKEETWISKNKSKHPLSVYKRYEDEINLQDNLFYGILPPLNKTRKEFDEWETVQSKLKQKDEKYKNKKRISKEYSWISKDKHFIKLNYKDKGCHYIQIKDYGLYHLGEDICNFNVPEFNPESVKIRLRCKRRQGKNCVPSSITVSSYPYKLEKSNYSLDTIEKLPLNLIYKK